MDYGLTKSLHPTAGLLTIGRDWEVHVDLHQKVTFAHENDGHKVESAVKGPLGPMALHIGSRTVALNRRHAGRIYVAPKQLFLLCVLVGSARVYLGWVHRSGDR